MKKRRILIKILLAALIALAAFSAFAACNKDDNGKPDADIIDDEPDVMPEKTVTATKLVTYDGPNLLDASDKVSVKVEGTPLFVYETRVNHDRMFSYASPNTTAQVVVFDFEGRVKVEVEVNGAAAVSEAVVRPFVMGVTPAVVGNKISFTLDYPASYTLEYLDDGGEPAYKNALHIFANPLETEPVDAENIPENTVYIGPGVYMAGAIPVKSNTTVYLAGGAFVYGQIRAELVENLTICGRGIISGAIFRRQSAPEYTLPIEIRSSNNVTIRDIAILDPAGWAVTIYKCDGVNIDNLKIITARANGDGISLQSSKNVTVSGGFVRSWDDSLVVKNVDRGTTSNIVFNGVTVWTDLAQSCEIGFETNGATMDSITFKNINIIHNFHKAALSIHNADDAAISNITYKNITLEDGQMLGDNRNDGLNDYFIDINIGYSAEWSKTPKRGPVTGVTFRNIKVINLADTVVSRIQGEDSGAMVSGVDILHLTIEGKNITSKEDLKLATNNQTSDISVMSAGAATGAKKILPYILALTSESVEKVSVPGKIQQGLEVPDFAILDLPESYMGAKIDIAGVEISATHGVGAGLTAPWDDGSGAFETAGSPAANLIDGNRATSWVAKPWTGEADEFAAITFNFNRKVKPGVIRVKFAENATFYNEYYLGVRARINAGMSSFPSALSPQYFTSSPATGNYFDIKLSSALECYELQLRIFRRVGAAAPAVLAINEIEFYPNSLSTRAPVESSEHNDVYVPEFAVDGNDNTYFEAKTVDAYMKIDLGAVYTLQHINLHLPALLTWEPRYQTIEIQISQNGTDFTTLFAAASYLFDPMTGNKISLAVAGAAEARYVKLVWSENTSLGGYGAQLSEIYVYGE
ncbi:MAG TPA: discoidin domain-containing protein [Eubacteriales bacterium]|nr:discoidin domain-containing protein [Clostridia bacterium]HRR89286.1 discoidin domain-containing protein [Eubacteriales bacterium]